MSDIYWPTDLPQAPVRSSYTVSTAVNTLRIAMDSGPAKTRRRSSSSLSSRALTYILKEEYFSEDGRGPINQKKLFLDFYDVVDCDLSFWLPDPENPSQYIKVRLKAKSDEEGVEYTSYAYKVWSANLQLEVWPHARKDRV